MAFVYALKDPDTKEVRYIGKTTKPSVKDRLITHVAQCNYQGKSNVTHHWIRDMIYSRNKIPIVELLEETDEPDGCEEWWIRSFYNDDAPLLNTRFGKYGGVFPALSAKMSMSARLRFADKEKKARWKEGMRGAIGWKGVPTTEEAWIDYWAYPTPRQLVSLYAPIEAPPGSNLRSWRSC